MRGVRPLARAAPLAGPPVGGGGRPPRSRGTSHQAAAGAITRVGWIAHIFDTARNMKLHRTAIPLYRLALLATEPNDATKALWAHIVALANDGMEGRDTGSEGYRKAEHYVVGAVREGRAETGRREGLHANPSHCMRCAFSPANRRWNWCVPMA